MGGSSWCCDVKSSESSWNEKWFKFLFVIRKLGLWNGDELGGETETRVEDIPVWATKPIPSWWKAGRLLAEPRLRGGILEKVLSLVCHALEKAHASCHTFQEDLRIGRTKVAAEVSANVSKEAAIKKKECDNLFQIH